MNQEYDIKTRARKSLNRYLDFIKENGWFDNYKEVPGIDAYKDGTVNGYNNGYVDACISIKEHIKFIVRHNPDIKLSDYKDFLIESDI